MRRIISRLLPDSLKQRIRMSTYYQHRVAAQLAISSKRVDICSAQFAHMLHLSGYASLEDKVCLEVGAGRVLSHALVCYLLGARRVIATDVAPLARPEIIRLAVHRSIASLSRDLLAPFSDHARVRKRFDRLLSIPTFSFGVLEDLGIEYRCPVDYAAERLPFPIDFIYSWSVLEHVPVDDLPGLLRNLSEGLSRGGAMIHAIHLEDHKDSAGSPFEFLGMAESRFTRGLQTTRGNRVRASEWERMFHDLEGSNTSIIYKYAREDKVLPESIDRSIRFRGETDLRTSHLGFYTRKNEQEV